MKNGNKYPIILIFLVVIFIYSFFFGNPLFRRFAVNTATEYISQNYENCYLDEVYYNIYGIFPGYRATVKSDTDADFVDTLYMDIAGLAVNEKAMEFMK